MFGYWVYTVVFVVYFQFCMLLFLLELAWASAYIQLVSVHIKYKSDDIDERVSVRVHPNIHSNNITIAVSSIEYRVSSMSMRMRYCYEYSVWYISICICVCIMYSQLFMHLTFRLGPRFYDKRVPLLYIMHNVLYQSPSLTDLHSAVCRSMRPHHSQRLKRCRRPSPVFCNWRARGCTPRPCRSKACASCSSLSTRPTQRSPEGGRVGVRVGVGVQELGYRSWGTGVGVGVGVGVRSATLQRFNSEQPSEGCGGVAGGGV